MGVHTNTVTLGNYVRYIENTFLIQGVQRYDVKGKKALEGEKKYFLSDLGFKNFLSSGFDPAAGKMLENYVFNLLNYCGYQVYAGTLGHHEIDFIAEKKDRKIYLQVTYLMADPQVIEREYSALEYIKDQWEKAIVSLDDLQFKPKEGIRHLQAWHLHDYLE
jgi:predicted AAA+ superfamily ATPase